MLLNVLSSTVVNLAVQLLLLTQIHLILIGQGHVSLPQVYNNSFCSSLHSSSVPLQSYIVMTQQCLKSCPIFFFFTGYILF